MLIRFIEFLKDHDTDVSLYFIQQPCGLETECFQVQVVETDAFIILLCKETGKKWTIAPQDVPQWIVDLNPLMDEIIEQRIKLR